MNSGVINHSPILLQIYGNTVTPTNIPDATSCIPATSMCDRISHRRDHHGPPASVCSSHSPCILERSMWSPRRSRFYTQGKYQATSDCAPIRLFHSNQVCSTLRGVRHITLGVRLQTNIIGRVAVELVAEIRSRPQSHIADIGSEYVR